MVSTMRCAFCVCGLVMLVATAAVDVAAQNAASTERSWSFGGGTSRLSPLSTNATGGLAPFLEASFKLNDR